MFLHADIEHIASNMIIFVRLRHDDGKRETGHVTFGVLYFLTGIIVNAASLFYKIYMGEWAVASLEQAALYSAWRECF